MIILFVTLIFLLVWYYNKKDKEKYCKFSQTGEHEYGDWIGHSYVAYKQRYCKYCPKSQTIVLT